MGGRALPLPGGDAARQPLRAGRARDDGPRAVAPGHPRSGGRARASLARGRLRGVPRVRAGRGARRQPRHRLSVAGRLRPHCGRPAAHHHARPARDCRREAARRAVRAARGAGAATGRRSATAPSRRWSSQSGWRRSAGWRPAWGTRSTTRSPTCSCRSTTCGATRTMPTCRRRCARRWPTPRTARGGSRRWWRGCAATRAGRMTCEPLDLREVARAALKVAVAAAAARGEGRDRTRAGAAGAGRRGAPRAGGR